MPHISIITVVRDDFENFILTAVSLSRQTDPNFEWVVVDGSSDDRISSYLNQESYRFTVVYRALAPEGIYSAMNFGVRISSSKWIWVLNAGDFFLLPNATAKMSSLLQDCEADLIASRVINLSASGYMVSISKPEVIHINGYAIANFNHQGVVMLKKNLELIGFFDETLKLAADGKLLDEAIRKFTFHCTDEVFVAFQLGGASSRNIKHTIRETLEYRPAIVQRTTLRKVLIRNFVRLQLLSAERKFVIKWIGMFYFKNREDKLLSDLQNLSSNHTFTCSRQCHFLSHVNEACYEVLKNFSTNVPRNSVK